LIIDPTLGKPVRNLQSFLRRISAGDSDIPPVIPDGIFGAQTEASVIAFREKYGPPPAVGEVDYDTWLRIVEVHDDIVFLERIPATVNLFPAGHVIPPGGDSVHLPPIQGMIASLSRQFPQLGTGAMSGIHDDASVDAVKKLQKLFGLPQSGSIDRAFWEQFVPFYETHINRGHHADDNSNFVL